MPWQTPAVRTEDAFNSEIGDGVDYLDPRSLAQTAAIVYHLIGNSADGLDTNSSGSGLATLNAGYYKANTGSTSGSYGEFRTPTRVGYMTVPSWDKGRSFAVGGKILDAVDSRVDHIVTGVPGPNSPGTYNAVGMKVSSGKILGVVASAGAETTTTLDSNPSTGRFTLRVDYDPNSPSVEFYLNGNDTPDGEITSGLPSGTDAARILYGQRIDNTAAVNRRIWITDARVVQLP